MKLFKLKGNLRVSDFIESLDMLMLGINSEYRKKLVKVKEENNIFVYNDILFQAIIQDDRQSWWHTDIWTFHER